MSTGYECEMSGINFFTLGSRSVAHFAAVNPQNRGAAFLRHYGGD